MVAGVGVAAVAALGAVAVLGPGLLELNRDTGAPTETPTATRTTTPQPTPTGSATTQRTSTRPASSLPAPAPVPSVPSFSVPSINIPSVNVPTRPAAPAVTPVVAGWQAISDGTSMTPYDVPAEFTRSDPSAMTGFATKKSTVGVREYASWRLGACTNAKGRPASLGVVGFGGMDKNSTDSLATVTSYSQRWAQTVNAEYESGAEYPVGEPTIRPVALEDQVIATFRKAG